MKENQTKAESHDNSNVLVVAEKFQTSFDESLLHTMIVDKTFYQETNLEQEVNVNLIYQTERAAGLCSFNENDIATDMGKMTSVLKLVADRYNLKNPEDRYQFQRLCRTLIRYYSYLTQIVRRFDKDMRKEYLFLYYLLGLLPVQKRNRLISTENSNTTSY